MVRKESFVRSVLSPLLKALSLPFASEIVVEVEIHGPPVTDEPPTQPVSSERSLPSQGALYMEYGIKWPDYDGRNGSLHFEPAPTWADDVAAVRAFRETESGGVYNYRNKVLMGMAQTRVLNQPPSVTAKEDVMFEVPMDVVRPETDEELMMMSVLEMQGLLRTGQLTSVELTNISLTMLDMYDPEFNMLEIALTDLAMAKAEEADQMFVAGEYLSAIQGIPFAIKVSLTIGGNRPSTLKLRLLTSRALSL